MSERDDILQSIEGKARSSLRHPGKWTGPAAISSGDNLALFKKKAMAASAKVAMLDSWAAIPAFIEGVLKIEVDIEAKVERRKIRIAPDPRLAGLDWNSCSEIEIIEAHALAAGPEEEWASVTPAFAAIAETGSLAFISEAPPLSLVFLSHAHFAVLEVGQILATSEDLWVKARKEFGAHWPRALSLVTGPSRSADIEQTLLMGAHGPRQLHILVVPDEA